MIETEIWPYVDMYNICNREKERKSLIKSKSLSCTWRNPYRRPEELHICHNGRFLILQSCLGCFTPAGPLGHHLFLKQGHRTNILQRTIFSSPVYCAKECLTVWQLPGVLGFLTGGYSSRAIGGLRRGDGGLGASFFLRAAPLCGVLSILTFRVLQHLLNKRRHWSWNLHL